MVSGPRFSDRFGYKEPDAEITVREDAPEAIREGVVMLGFEAGLDADAMRELVCTVLLKRPDPNNWSPGNVRGEVHWLVEQAPWFKVYDIAERLYATVKHRYMGAVTPEEYEGRLNRLFLEHGVGWQMEHGEIMARGSEAFASATRDAVEAMRQAGAPTAANEIHEALADISRRPSADVTGAIQHAMAALECVAREVDGSTDTLGQIIGRLGLPKPLDGALHKLWGFASEQGRHIQEGRPPRFEEAELVVTVAAGVATYLLRHRLRP